MTAVKHLWEHKHPYYMETGCYYASGLSQPHTEYESWVEFLKEMGDADEDYNYLVRWDWALADEDYADEDSHETLSLFFVAQRKAFTFSFEIRVSAVDEPAVREYLENKAAYVRRVWEPLLGD
jgi:hypothetical protein